MTTEEGLAMVLLVLVAYLVGLLLGYFQGRKKKEK